MTETETDIYKVFCQCAIMVCIEELSKPSDKVRARKKAIGSKMKP